MSESVDYEPAPWAKAHDFGTARAAYQQHVGSSMGSAQQAKVRADQLIEPKLMTEAKRPLIIVIDETGSMGEWPTTIFSKLPYLDHEVRDYLGDDAEIAFMAVGDAANRNVIEKYPLQARQFASGQELTVRLQELIHERQGGGNGGETYELAALYLLHNLEVAWDAEPIVIFIADEEPFNSISVEHAKQWVKVDSTKSFATSRVFEELCEKCAVYLVQKPYDLTQTGNKLDHRSQAVQDKWARLIGLDHIAVLPDPARVVDVIFGILAAEADRVSDFKQEVKGRQTSSQVETVMRSLETIHAVRAPKIAGELGDGKSIMLKDLDEGTGSSSLI